MVMPHYTMLHTEFTTEIILTQDINIMFISQIPKYRKSLVSTLFLYYVIEFSNQFRTQFEEHIFESRKPRFSFQEIDKTRFSLLSTIIPSLHQIFSH